MYKKRSLESSETPVLYTGRTVPEGQISQRTKQLYQRNMTSTDRFPAGMWTLIRDQILRRNCTIVDRHTNPTMSCYAASITSTP